MKYVVVWSDKPSTRRRDPESIAPVKDARETEKEFDTEGAAAKYVRELLAGGKAHDVTLTLSDGTKLTGVPLTTWLREREPA